MGGSSPLKKFVSDAAAVMTYGTSTVAGSQAGGDVKSASDATGAQAQGAYNSMVKGESPEIAAPGAPSDVPSAANAASAMDEAGKKQRSARGSSSTIFGGGSGLMSGGSTSQRMLLGS